MPLGAQETWLTISATSALYAMCTQVVGWRGGQALKSGMFTREICSASEYFHTIKIARLQMSSWYPLRVQRASTFEGICAIARAAVRSALGQIRPSTTDSLGALVHTLSMVGFFFLSRSWLHRRAVMQGRTSLSSQFIDCCGKPFLHSWTSGNHLLTGFTKPWN